MKLNSQLRAELAKRRMLDSNGKVKLSKVNQQGVIRDNPYQNRENKTRLALSVNKYTLNGIKKPEDFTRAGKLLSRTALSMEEHEYRTMFAQNSEPVQQLPADAFLRNVNIEAMVISQVGPRQFFLDRVFRQVMRQPAKEITWARFRNAFDTDPKLKEPKEYQWGNPFPRTGVSDPEIMRASTSTWAQAIEFNYETRRYLNTAFDTINRQISWVTQKFNQTVNTHIANVMANDFDPNQTNFTDAEDQIIVVEADETWDSDNRDPIKNIRDGIETMANFPGHRKDATTLLVQNTDFRRLMDYFTNVDHVWARDPTTGQIIREVDGVMIEKVPADAGLPQGSALLLAEGPGEPPIVTLWDDVDERFTQSGIVHVRQFEDPENMNRVVMMHKTFAAANRNQKAVCHISGI